MTYNSNKKGFTPLEINSNARQSYNFSQKINNGKSLTGFTLLELLIVIAIIAVLSVILILLLDPAETLRKARDSQRISDLNTLKTAFGIYITSKKIPQLDGVGGTVNDSCVGGSSAKIWVSEPDTVGGGETITDTPPSGFNAFVQSTSTVNVSLTNGTGWVPVNISSITGGSPISNLPLDPTNTVTIGTSTAALVSNAALVYRYACRKSPLSFEINAALESLTYGPNGEDDRGIKDGGNNSSLYEVGTDLTILPNTNDF